MSTEYFSEEDADVFEEYLFPVLLKTVPRTHAELKRRLLDAYERMSPHGQEILYGLAEQVLAEQTAAEEAAKWALHYLMPCNPTDSG